MNSAHFAIERSMVNGAHSRNIYTNIEKWPPRVLVGRRQSFRPVSGP